MHPFELEYDELHLHYDRGVFELFRYPGSQDYRFRVPVRWLSVQLQFKRPEKGRLHFGSVRDPALPIYSLHKQPWGFSYPIPFVQILPRDEPLFRDYFQLLADECGRTVD